MHGSPTFRKSMASFAFLAMALVMPKYDAWACSCMEPPPPKIALDQATAVFVGKVIEMKPLDPSTPESIQDGVNTVLFDVSQAWKGIESARVTIQTLNSLAACGYPFQVGEEYLVYASGKVGDLYVYQCSRTQHLPSSSHELETLGEDTFRPEDEDWPPLRLISEHPIPSFVALAALAMLVVAYLKKSRG